MRLGIKLALLSTVLVGAVVATTSWVFTQSLRRAGEREVDTELHSDALLVSHAVRTGQLAEDVLTELPRPGLSWLWVREGRVTRAKLTKEVERERTAVESSCIENRPSDGREQLIGGQRYRSLSVDAGSGSHGCLLRSIDGVIDRARSVQTTLFAVGRGAVLLALLSGLIQIGLGALGAGWLLNLLSRPVMAGFTNPAALVRWSPWCLRPCCSTGRQPA